MQDKIVKLQAKVILKMMALKIIYCFSQFIVSYIGVRPRVKLNGEFLKQDKANFTHGKVVNIYTVYDVNLQPYKYDDDPTLGNSLFGAVKLVRNADIDKYKYSGYGIRFDVRGSFSLSGGSIFVKNLIYLVLI